MPNAVGVQVGTVWEVCGRSVGKRGSVPFFLSAANSQPFPAQHSGITISTANKRCEAHLVATDDEADWEDVARLMKQASKQSRGHAGFWEYPPETRLAKLGPALELAKYYLGGAAVDQLRLVEPDPPDLSLDMPDGTRIGIEITELVDPDAAARARYLKKQRSPEAGSDQILNDARWPDWPDERLDTTLRDHIRKKDAELRIASETFDRVFLAIMTHEPDIDMAKAARVAACLNASALNIDRVFLILSYDPSADKVAFPGGYPIFEIGLS